MHSWLTSVPTTRRQRSASNAVVVPHAQPSSSTTSCGVTSDWIVARYSCTPRVATKRVRNLNWFSLAIDLVFHLHRVLAPKRRAGHDSTEQKGWKPRQ